LMYHQIKLSLAYLRYYQKQSVILFLGFFMSAFLLTRISSLMLSNRMEEQEQIRNEYGDWHYQYTVPKKTTETLWKRRGTGYRLKNIGWCKEVPLAEKPYRISFCSANEEYMKMMGRSLVEGRRPQKENEIVIDAYAIHNLDLNASIGQTVLIGGESFTVSGIVSDGVSMERDRICIYGNTDSKRFEHSEDERMEYYITFAEDQAVYPQVVQFCKEYKIFYNDMKANEKLSSYVRGERRESVFRIIRTAIHLPGGRLFYLLGTLNEQDQLLYHVIIAGLVLFGIFIIRSILEILLEKRRTQYGLMDVLGISELQVISSLLLELLILEIPAYSIGAVLGNITAALWFRGAYIRFCVDWGTISWGFIFDTAAITLICVSDFRRMRRYTKIQQMNHTMEAEHWNRKIVSKRRHDLVTVVSRRFLFGKRKTAAGIFISLSLGGVLFLGTAYTAHNTNVNQEHKRQTDHGCYTDLRVEIDEPDLSYVIPKQAVDDIRKIDGVKEFYPVSYSLGEIPLLNGILRWTKYFAEIANDPENPPDKEMMERYHGRITKQSEKDYRLKVNVYGYCDEELEQLSDYLLEGSIQPVRMREHRGVILKTIMDGVGYYNGINLNVGDTIKVKVPKQGRTRKEILRFEGDSEEYVEKEFVIDAVVSRCLSENNHFIGGGTSNVAVILPQSMMESEYDIHDYNSIDINYIKDCDVSNFMKKVRGHLRGLSHCVMKNQKEEMEESRKNVRQKTFFFYGIAVIFFMISLLHSVNSIHYILFSRKHEFGILRAMGITDARFRLMLFKEGVRYGSYKSLVMTALFLVLQRILASIMQHVLKYIIVDQSIDFVVYLLMIMVNIVVCVSGMMFLGKGMLQENIIEEIRE